MPSTLNLLDYGVSPTVTSANAGSDFALATDSTMRLGTALHYSRSCELNGESRSCVFT